ncbi:thioredoxin domain-containing protein 16-like [Sphaerodactylus townsendi]|uniref:thioredoxin domain-containing protein 16-like n=1 Tax=Sphaerodactylus townsendi TaxID=933632 RepID=UPI0020271DA3|nr:thioredoxin domain-containing protein 16-like [Sphaerodactylus townsendi]
MDPSPVVAAASSSTKPAKGILKNRSSTSAIGLAGAESSASLFPATLPYSNPNSRRTSEATGVDDPGRSPWPPAVEGGSLLPPPGRETPGASPSADVFLEQLEKSAEALRDYGISVLKVNCHQGEMSAYCKEDSSVGKAYLFKGHTLIRVLPTDALFSVDAIVANVLFALLFNEVKYVATPEDLRNLENDLRGQSDLVFVYVQAVGTAEHRVLMEVAFVYGSLHRFALTTEVTLLKSIHDEETDTPASKLFFCHCKVATDPGQPCRRTLMEQPLTTLDVHKFLKLMGEPLVMEVAANPEEVSTAHFQLGLPLIFVLTQRETLEADRRTAEFVAWRLLGKAGVVLLSRGVAGLDFLLRYNVAIKTAAEGVKYLVLKDTDEIIALVESGKQSDSVPKYEEEEEEEEEEAGESYEQEIQDDEVVESVVRDRKHELSLEHIQTLTEESFSAALANSDFMVVLFYASWEAVSLVMMQSYAQAAARLKGMDAKDQRAAKINSKGLRAEYAKQFYGLNSLAPVLSDQANSKDANPKTAFPGINNQLNPSPQITIMSITIAMKPQMSSNASMTAGVVCGQLRCYAARKRQVQKQQTHLSQRLLHLKRGGWDSVSSFQVHTKECVGELSRHREGATWDRSDVMRTAASVLTEGSFRHWHHEMAELERPTQNYPRETPSCRYGWHQNILIVL